MMLYKGIRPLIFKLEPETAHSHLKKASRIADRSNLIGAVLRRRFRFESDLLFTNVFGIDFPNPVGLAAGFDKSAELINLIELLGFGFMEIGSVTAHPHRGNQGPRVMRLPDDSAIINRMGLNNDGADAVGKRLLMTKPNIPVGINLAKTPRFSVINATDRNARYGVKDFLYSFEVLYPYSAYIVLNLSCPNTADGRRFEQEHALDSLLSRIGLLRESLKIDYDYKPVLLKLSPDIEYDNLVSILKMSSKHGVDGLVIGNTTKNAKGTKTPAEMIERFGPGGLSGRPLKKMSTEMTARVYELTRGKLPIIGCGGVFTAEDAFEKISAGASLVQIYTSLVYNGPGVVRSINSKLTKILKSNGLSGIDEAVGRMAHV